jgi:hypothetical protein
MISYSNPIIELNPSPVALDLAIQSIQQKLSGLGFFEKVFGRAIAQQKVNTKQEQGSNAPRIQIIPEVYNNREPLDLMINDNLAAYCFFYCKDPLKFEDFEHHALSQPVSVPVSIICWMNLEKIDSSKNYNFGEELRLQIVQKLAQCPELKLTESFTEFDQVFKPFTITETFRQYLKPPYYGARFNGNLYFDYTEC